MARRYASSIAGAHDRIFAAVSHLPHLLAFALVEALATRPDAEDIFRYAASGFRDFTRIAAGSPEMWRDISLANRDALLAEVTAFRAQLDRIAAMVAAGDAVALEAVFARASAARRAWGAQHATGAERPGRRAARNVGVAGRSTWPQRTCTDRLTSILHPAAHARGKVVLPGSKSISNRTLLLAALADGATTLRGLLDADDVDRMLDALVALGIRVERVAGTRDVVVYGTGGTIPAPSAEALPRQCRHRVSSADRGARVGGRLV